MVINDFVMVIGSYTAIIFIAFFIVGWLQAGFFMPFLKVKTSRGKKILVRIRKPTGSDFVPAVEKEGQLSFKYFKEKKLISNYKTGIYRSFNMNCVDVDPETWAVVTTSFEAVSTNDPNKTDSLIERALLKPGEKSLKEKIIIFLLILIAVVVIFVAYKLNFLQTSITGLGAVAGQNL